VRTAVASRDPTIEDVAIATLGKKGRLTIPKQLRQNLGLDPGAPFAVLRMGDALLLLPQQQQFERLCQRISENLGNAGVSEEIALATLPEARKRVFTRHYGEKRGRQR